MTSRKSTENKRVCETRMQPTEQSVNSKKNLEGEGLGVQSIAENEIPPSMKMQHSLKLVGNPESEF